MSSTNGPGHFGLVGIRERASEIGAELMVSSSPELGTKVSIRLLLGRSSASESNVDRPAEHQLR